jgi:hypothetical protein
MRICLVNFCDLSNISTPDMLNRVPWIWDGGYDGPFIDSASLDIEVQEFEPLPGKEHKHILNVGCAGTTTSTNPEVYAIPVDCLPSLDTLVTWVLDTTRYSGRACFGSGFHGTFLSLALRYYECERDLPLVSLFPLSCQYDLRIQHVDRVSFWPPVFIVFFCCPLFGQPTTYAQMINNV